MKSDAEIAREARLQPITEIAAGLGLEADDLHLYGRHIAKIDPAALPPAAARKGKLVLVTAISPTPAGEGKTTTTIGLGDALNRIGRKTVICLREPSLGPCFGLKGGAAGGGYAQIVPMERINLHFTGDFHAISAAHNLLAAMVDNHLYWGNELGLDSRRITWRRVVDMNDRALRNLVVGLGGPRNGVPREGGFDITVASEVMAAFCLAKDFADLEARLSRMIVGFRRDRSAVTAADLKTSGAMCALLADAFMPNLVQTIGGSPALVHGGPFANIAHGCNSVVATEAGLGLGDIVVTEAGFGADLGAEKFLDIKCRQAGLSPDCAVVVATVRALKMHGGVAKDALGQENVETLKAGLANLGRHIENVKKYGLPVVVAVNHFTSDTAAEFAAVRDFCRERFGVEAISCSHWAHGAAGAEDLAHAVAAVLDAGAAAFRPLYADGLPLLDKIRTVATEIYGAADIAIDARLKSEIADYEAAGFGELPVCIAKTQYSFSANPDLRGAPSGHVLPVREVRLAAGAGFLVVICGEINTMPGLPRVPAAEHIGIDSAGRIVGLS
ncbi:formate--tetrahydrofolate ligase [Segnochrobactrum spirostomi]|uniref:Formate--tetrahydrofolate ligase n=1 Tax=Segnochrobactrum spirostomi TaxID=2608987 RepID=A0A6A7Y5I6_9HYPH|nr:formate--tetrahydrofolate ligase [Segnochrobactrum spirostomi]MQT13351.1 formate--tetrahydrofolate ligase [Segnochrobactrum spirostomi]